jgi:hypothetical protein
LKPLAFVFGALLMLAAVMGFSLAGKAPAPSAYVISLYQSGWLTRAYEADSVEQDGDTLTFRDRKTGEQVTVCGGWVLETSTKGAK